jgi:hypothetical protein
MTGEAKLRSMIQGERKLIATLDSKVGLRLASSTLDLVEIGCLGKEAMEQRRSPAELAWWLGQTEKLLQVAILHRKHVEDMSQNLAPTFDPIQARRCD